MLNAEQESLFMYIQTKKFKRHLFIALTVLLAVALVIPLASLFQQRPKEQPAPATQSLLQRQAELEALLAGDPVNPEALIELGEIYLSFNDTETAMELFTQALAIDPLNYDAMYKVAELNYSIGEHDLAIEQLETIVTDNPNYAEASWLLGYAYGMGKNDYTAAIRALENYVAVAEPGIGVETAKQSIEEWRKIINE